MDYVDHQILALAGQNRRLVVKNLDRIEQILRSQAPPVMLRTRDFGGLQVPAWSAASRKKGRLLESAIHAVRFGLKARATSLLKQFLDVDPAPVGAPEDAVFALRNMLAGHPAFSMYSIPYETYMQIPEEIREVDEHPEWVRASQGWLNSLYVHMLHRQPVYGIPHGPYHLLISTPAGAKTLQVLERATGISYDDYNKIYQESRRAIDEIRRESKKMKRLSKAA
jgi:hypothetical protein